MQLPRDELVRLLRARVLLYAASLDEGALLTPETLVQARALIAAAPDATADPEAVRTLAEVFRFRANLLGVERGRKDAALATALSRAADGPPKDAGPQPSVDPSGSADRRRFVELRAAAERTADVALLTEALEAARAELATVPVGLPDRVSVLVNLGLTYSLRFEWTGALADLHQAIGVLRDAEAAAGAGHPGRADASSALGVALRLRYEHTGALADLQDAIALSRQAVAATPDGDHNQGGRLLNLGIALRRRYQHGRVRADLEEALQVHRESVAVTEPDHPGYVIFWNGLGNTLSIWRQLTDDPAARAEEVAAFERALAAAAPGDQRRAMLAVNLAGALTHPDASDTELERAVTQLREALDALPAADPRGAVCRYELALALERRHQRAGSAEDLAEAVGQVRTTARQSGVSPQIRLQAAVAWGRWAMDAGDPALAVQGYELAVELLPARAARQLDHADAEHALTDFPGLASDAAACALAAGDPGRAVELLERGRGILLDQALHARTDLDELRAVEPESAARFGELRDALAAGRSTVGRYDAVPDSLHVLADELEQLLARIRGLPGLDRFLRPLTLEQLLAQAAEGPIVLVNVSRHRCDALLLTPDGLQVVPLPGLEAEATPQRLSRFLDALDRLAGTAGLAEQRRLERTLADGLAWLWDAVTGPVLDALDPGEQTRVWWIPTGPLVYLPLHAAGHARPADGPNVLDRVVSSYAPTVRALARARRPHPTGPGRHLVVAVPEPPGAPPLPGAAREARAVADALPGTRLLTGTEATWDAVMSALREHDWLHFCGHGRFEAADPSSSRLLLHDHAEHPLTVADLSVLDLTDAELAYLSACATARTGFELPNEGLHLAGALQLAGYRHVVGTLWEVEDREARRIAEQVYAELGAPDPDADRAARAVHTAARAERERYPATPSVWAAHVHVGA